MLDSVDASQSHTSQAVQIDKRAIWKLIIDKAGTDGNPNLFIEEAYNGGGCLTPPTDYYLLPNKCNDLDYFPLDDSPVTIEKDKLSGNYLRVRIEPNGTTTGTVKVLLAYKTFV